MNGDDLGSVIDRFKNWPGLEATLGIAPMILCAGHSDSIAIFLCLKSEDSQ
jgi:hypothetical protein